MCYSDPCRGGIQPPPTEQLLGEAGGTDSEWAMFKASIVEARSCGQNVIRVRLQKQKKRPECNNTGVGVQGDYGEALLVGLKEVLANHETTQKRKPGLALAAFRREEELWIWIGDLVEQWKEHSEEILNTTNRGLDIVGLSWLTQQTYSKGAGKDIPSCHLSGDVFWKLWLGS